MIDMNYYTRDMFADDKSFENAKIILNKIAKIIELKERNPAYEIYDTQEKSVFPIDFRILKDGTLVRNSCYIIIGCCTDEESGKYVIDDEAIDIFNSTIRIIKTEKIDLADL